ncbi:L,D-transpeptidase family protein [Adlercreutzia sp. ZJ141]|uniref:L,D-transpeptidase family protein n=1 Tax=Adlercreutzia sp. ZJ141 TaxID=2709406 RepID=UPI0013EAF003|nr:L,D-transpeptidase family protein [Adlercreutzia sp. ZJ141]
MPSKPDKANRGRHAAKGNTPPARAATTKIPAMPPQSTTAMRSVSGVRQQPRIPQLKKKRFVAKVVAITLAVVVALAAVVYSGVALYFSSHFMPDTTLGNFDMSLMSSKQAEDFIAEQVADYELTVTGKDFSVAYTSSDIGLALNESEVVSTALRMTNPWAWPLELRRAHDVSEALVTTHDRSQLNDKVTAAVETYNVEAEQPVDATIAYEEDLDRFVISSEKVGTALDPKAVLSAVDQAIVTFSNKLELTESELLQPAVFSDDEALAAAEGAANAMVATSFDVTAGGELVFESDPDMVATWIKLDENLQVSFDDEALAAWAGEISSGFSTIGSTRTYTRPDGKQCTVTGGIYGWDVDAGSLVEQVKAIVTSGEGGTVNLPYKQTADKFAPQGEQDWGDRYVDVDLAEQHVRFFDGGNLIWESDCVSGAPDGKNDTPTGVYVLNAKESPSVLIGYENGKKTYESKVQYWMPWVGNLVGFHDADWQAAFGGTRYADGFGSHGCINLPVDKAANLYGLIQPGDTVVCHW